MLSLEERGILARLQRWRDDIQRIMDLYDRDRPILPRQHVDEARTLYAKLKAELGSEYKTHQSSRRKPPLTDAEKRWYVDVVHEAFVHLHAAVNHAPEKIFSSLYDAQTDVDFRIGEMNRYGATAS